MDNRLLLGVKASTELVGGPLGEEHPGVGHNPLGVGDILPGEVHSHLEEDHIVLVGQNHLVAGEGNHLVEGVGNHLGVVGNLREKIKTDRHNLYF